MKSLWKNTLLVAVALAAAGLALAQSAPSFLNPPFRSAAAADTGAAGGNTPPTARGARGGMGEARQPRMRDALLDLNSARIALRDAVPDKGGLRDKAIQSVEQAIKDVQAGIAYADAHPEEFPGAARGPRGGARGMRGTAAGSAGSGAPAATQ